MPDTAYTSMAEDLDTIRRSLNPEGEFSPHLARFLAACGGTLRGWSGTVHVARDEPRRDDS